MAFWVDQLLQLLHRNESSLICWLDPGMLLLLKRKDNYLEKVGIDLFAGPTETMVIADNSVDAENLLGQVEHGFNSPRVL